MSQETQEPVKVSPFGNMPFTRRDTSTRAEEPVIEQVKEEVVTLEDDKAAEQVKVDVEKPAAETKVDGEPSVEETPKTVVSEDEKGVVTLDFGQKEAPKVEDSETIQAYKTRQTALEEELAALKETPKLDPRIAKLNEIILNGGDINQSVWEMQSKDYDKLDLKDSANALSVVKDKLKYLDGDDSDLVGFYLDKNFPVLSGKKGEDDFDSDEDFADAKKTEELLLRKEAKGNIGSLKEFQNTMRLPEAPNHNQKADYEKAVQNYRADAILKVDEISTFDVVLDGDTTLRIPITGEAKKFARAIATEPENQGQFFVKRYRGEDGQTNLNKLYTEMYYLENREQIEKALYNQGRSAGKKEITQELQGGNGSPQSKKPVNKTTAKNPFAGLQFSRQQTR
jgi:hypothetical protein